jgi:hypothetical protein
LKRASLLVQALQVAISAIGLGLYLAGLLTIWPLAVLALTYGVVMSAHHPVRMALTPLLSLLPGYWHIPLTSFLFWEPTIWNVFHRLDVRWMLNWIAKPGLNFTKPQTDMRCPDGRSTA